MFLSSKPGAYQEDRKAQIKNHNLPILQHMYMGDPTTPLQCMISQTPAFIQLNDFVTGKTKWRFRLDFNHIRQLATANRHAGHSLDKGTRVPSGIFRETKFDSPSAADRKYLFEFMTIMPVCTEYHSYISQDSAKGDIVLTNFKRKHWPWILKSQKNYDAFCKQYDLPGVSYDQMIDHLSNIDYPGIHQRLSFDLSKRKFVLK